MKLSPAEIWAEYQAGLNYNASEQINLVERVRENEDFYIGDQWKGLNAPDLVKPVFNILKQVVSYAIAHIVSDDIAVSVTEFATRPGFKQVLDMLSRMFLEVMELSGFKTITRDALRNAAVDGDGYVHYYFDPGMPGDHDDDATGDAPAGAGTGEGNWVATPGTIQAELLDNTKVFFGNQQTGEVQKQPWILIQYRLFAEDVKETARQAGQAEDGIVPDKDEAGINADQETGKVTVLRKYYRKGGTVWFTETTQTSVVRPPTDTGYRTYPFAGMRWEKVKNQYHGQAAVTGMIPNQIFINLLYAMGMEHVRRMAFPKVVYDKSRMPEGWSNTVGAAIPVTGDPTTAVAAGVNPLDMSAQVMQMIQSVMNDTRDTMGANQTVLGNVKPENTSAIIAVQKQSAMPLELQRMEFYQFVEDSVRVWMEMMAQNYGIRPVEMTAPEGGDVEALPGVAADITPEAAPASAAMATGFAPEVTLPGFDPAMPGMNGGGLPAAQAEEDRTRLVLFDFSTLKGLDLRLNVDIGASTYWSELMQVQNMDALYTNGIITDPEVYLEMIPAAYLPNKNVLMDSVRKNKALAEAQMQMQMQAQAGGGIAQAGEALPGGMGQGLPGGAVNALMGGGVL